MEKKYQIQGNSPAIHELLSLIKTLAATDVTTLIEGESGTGKELVAREIHNQGPRHDKPFIAVNCAALPDSLLESELFGHEKGAFTGADKQTDGRFLLADGGTLFLDEIGDVSPSMQAKLLRAVQNKEIQRVGSGVSLSVDIRIISATHKPLKSEVRAGTFREDLYYRLNVVNVYVPPLRERKDDVELLTTYFLKQVAQRNNAPVPNIEPLALQVLTNYPWPGNVRELENALERAFVFAKDDIITLKDLPPGIYGLRDPADHYCLDHIGNIPLKDLEAQAIIATLKSTQGNKSEAARRLGITRKALREKMIRLDILDENDTWCKLCKKTSHTDYCELVTNN